MRNDADTWDITSGVGETALFVAAARGLASQHPQPLALDPFAELFCRAAGDEWAELFTHPERTGRHPLRTPEFGALFQDFQAARTRYFDGYLRSASEAGLRQVVILAAGLDARAYRLPWPPGTRVFEVDRRQVLAFKRDVVARAGIEAIAERREVPADLRDDWASVLRRTGFDPAVPTAWLVEGLIIYLTADAQDRLFTTVDALSAPGSRIGIEQMATIDPSVYAEMTAPPDEHADVHARKGTEWAGLIYNEPKSEAVHWFGKHGWLGTATGLVPYLRSLGRVLPPGAGRVGHFDPNLMGLASAVKQPVTGGSWQQ